MRVEEIFECRKQGNERCCLKSVIKHESEMIVDNLTEEETKIAEAAKQGAIEVLQDALKKKETVLMKLPKKVVLKGEAMDSCWMKRHAILTENLVNKLLEELKKVRFQKEISKKTTFAIVNPHDKTRTIYLGILFWAASNYLEKNSQPGTLIHEVSHFLGIDDFAYDKDVKPTTLYIGCKGDVVKDVHLTPASNSTASPDKENVHNALWKAFWNADNVEYEFELIINHKGEAKSYEGGKYPCCGETERYSVCAKSVPDSFYTCRVGEKLETRDVAKELCHRSKNMKDKLAELLKTSEEMEGYLRKAEASRKVGLSMGFAGGAAAVASLFLAPATLRIPVLVAGGVGVAGAGMGFISTKIFKAQATTQEEELQEFFAECHKFLNNVKRVIISINTVGGFQRDVGVQCTINLINQLQELVGSERNNVNKLQNYVKGINLCADLLENLCKIISN